MKLEVQRIKETRLRWFKRHLNWTLVIVWFGGNLFIGIFAVIIGLIFPTVTTDNALATTLTLVIFYFAALLATTDWVLEQKGRSRAWLLFFLLGGPLIPMIVTLLLSNNKSGQASH